MTLTELQRNYRPGTVETILVRTSRIVAPILLDNVNAISDIGLEGDHYQNTGGNRQVTLIQAEHLEVLASMLGVDKVAPELVRRNLVVKGINLLSLKGKKFKVGGAVLEYSGECHPCSRMEKNLGTGGYNAMRGHGGITAKVIAGGVIRVGDSVVISEGDNDVA
ncbi:MAG TPA: MOSC domain-containing protein [Chryseolinea sp.]